MVFIVEHTIYKWMIWGTPSLGNLYLGMVYRTYLGGIWGMVYSCLNHIIDLWTFGDDPPSKPEGQRRHSAVM